MSKKDSGKKQKAAESWRSAVGEDLLTRSEVEKLTGVTIRALEHYEKQGLLCPKRTRARMWRTTDACTTRAISNV